MMAMIVAATVGCPDVDRMLDSIERKQFNEWVALYNIAPWYIGFPVEKPSEESTIRGSMDVARRMAGV